MASIVRTRSGSLPNSALIFRTLLVVTWPKGTSVLTKGSLPCHREMTAREGEHRLCALSWGPNSGFSPRPVLL